MTEKEGRKNLEIRDKTFGGETVSEREEIQQLKAEKEALEARVKELELDLAHLNWICECKILHSNEESACPKCLCCNPGVGKIQALESKLEKAMKVVEAAPVGSRSRCFGWGWESHDPVSLLRRRRPSRLQW